MTPFILFFIFILIVGIIYFSGSLTSKKFSREEYLKEFCEYVGGTLEALEERQEGLRITFNFEGQQFVYEDFKEKGFKGDVNRACLKIKTASNLSLTFSEKAVNTRIRTDIFTVSNISTQMDGNKISIQMPKVLDNFLVHTNSIEIVNKLFENKKVVSILSGFKFEEDRGYCSMLLKIENGEIILDFHRTQSVRPNIVDMYYNISSIEGIADDVLVIVRQIEAAEKEIRS